MWLFTRYGFYSVTRSASERDKYQIRARCEADLDTLKARFGIHGPVIETPHADYRWRVIVTPSQWVSLAKRLAEEIDYSNFKNTIPDQRRHDLYSRVWGMMRQLQDDDRSQYGGDLFDDLSQADELGEDDDANDPFYDPQRHANVHD